ncbi:hypothetical protein MB901379_02488 [Mycobacterium basiliense]|uniref:V8-like Glu-specific endopeptidase n=1 Tax=Mycobacterium basiliense TaxID=2094119 RepID=A0A3S4BW65_9MYCO|nr:hypothetical protein [Mycobacterium basiliense]VDM88921.1 hypothetical protein MB901379_02488 [Mycobacterium basiliense]
MVGRLPLRAIVTSATVAALACVWAPTARAEPPLVFPGMEIHQDIHVCTLAYVDPAMHMAFSAGHCRGQGAVTDRANNVIGHLQSFRDNTPNGSTVATDQSIDDYEAIALVDDVRLSNILPGGRALTSSPGLALAPGQPVCHFGISTGETCGTVESVNNGWFTMTGGVTSQRGDSGGPVYLAGGGPGQLVGIFNSVWGDFPAAVSWRTTLDQIHQDLGAPFLG